MPCNIVSGRLMRRVGEGEVERLQEQEKGLVMVEMLDTDIWAHRDQCEDGQLLRLKEEKMELEKKLAEMNQPAALPGHLGTGTKTRRFSNFV